jgi:thiopurine S-methyltransferase
MDPDFWRARWAEHKIGFHEGAPNAFLQQHVDRLAEHHRVLVPMCGKTEDLAFLASRGHAVVGVELVETAVREFFTEHGLEPAIERRGEHAMFTAGDVALIAGDWFAATPALVGRVDAFYDRAAMIAMPPERRSAYVAKLRELCSGPGLAITLEYADGAYSGPPFAVSDAELRGYYRAELLGEAPNRGGRIAELGIASIERCYAIHGSQRSGPNGA